MLAEETQGYFRDTVLGARRYGFSTGRMEFADRWLDHELEGDLRRLVRRDGVQGIVAAVEPKTVNAAVERFNQVLQSVDPAKVNSTIASIEEASSSRPSP